MKHTFIGWLTVAGICLSACNSHIDLPENENFNSDWSFYKSSDTLMMPQNDAMWENVTLPHTANIEPLVVNDQWQGICFYKKQFELNPSLKNKQLSLQFDAAMNVADIWVNGQHMMHHMGGYLPFVVNLNKVARFDSINTILVRLDNRDNPVTGPKPLEILDFNMYGGLYRNVHLLVKNNIHLTNPVNANAVAGGGVFFATTQANELMASFDILSQVKNESNQNAHVNIINRLVDNNGQTVGTFYSDTLLAEAGSSVSFKIEGSLNNPQLWSPKQPSLYTLRTEVYSDNQLTDVQNDKVGIRTLKITPEGLWINGEKTFLRGVNRHQEYPYVGYALSDAAQYRDAYKIKQAGFDYVRCSHYPMSPAFLDACDELGIMVLDAILGWQYFGGKEFEQLALQSSRELIRRDRNHPSVLAWELSINETAMPTSFTDSASVIAHQEYPYNSCYSAGWVRQSYDIYIEARQHRHDLFTDKPLLVSEYGDWEYYAQNAGFNQQDWQDLMSDERNSRQPREAGEKRLLQQATNIQEAHNDNLSTHAFADGYWVMYDYNRGMAPDHEYSGIMDICRLPKFSYYFFQSQRNINSSQAFAEPMIFIASYWQPGISKGVRVFSNFDEVELFVDGKSVGGQKPDQNQISNNLFHPPFSFNVNCTQAGTIKAIGYINQQAKAEYSVTTPNAPVQIQLMVDESGKVPQMNDVLLVHAKICDNNCNTVTDSNIPVIFKINGAQLMSPAQTNAVAGYATAVIRTENHPGKLTIEASAEGLTSNQIQINIQ